MSKFKAYYRSSSSREPKNLGSFNTEDEAISEAYHYAKNEGDLYDCDPFEDVSEAIKSRGFYMIGYGPREIGIEEV